jgi:quinol monooxygenase YgiN
MIAGHKILVVAAGREREFERLFAELREQMRLHEPACFLYSLHRSRTNPHGYIVQEQYRDQAAHDAHECSKHVSEYSPRIRAVLDSIHAEYFDTVIK